MNNSITVKEDFFLKSRLYDDLFAIIPGIENASSVPVLYAKDLKEEVFKRDWVAENKPCLIKGAVEHWPAVQKWKEKEYWLSVCDDFEVTVFPHRNHNDMKRNKGEAMFFHGAMERLFSHRDAVFSMPSEKITDHHRFFRVLKDIKGFPFLTTSSMPRLYDRRRMFMYRQAATAWHYHAIDETLMCQVNGSKKVALLPPQIPRVKYVADFLQEERHLEGKSLDKSLNLMPAVVDVDEGDALYIPPYWHHGVVPNDDEVGFTLAFCWSSPWHKLGNFSNYFVRKLYRHAIWPFRKISPAVPFIACYAGIVFFLRSSGKALGRLTGM